MSSAFNSIRQGLTEAIDFAGGAKGKAIVHEFTPVDVKAIRDDIGMSQSEFASAFGISLGTLRHWERGDRKPRSPALVLLNVVKKILLLFCGPCLLVKKRLSFTSWPSVPDGTRRFTGKLYRVYNCTHLSITASKKTQGTQPAKSQLINFHGGY